MACPLRRSLPPSEGDTRVNKSNAISGASGAGSRCWGGVVSSECWRRLLRVPARRCNQSILKETNPEYSLEGLMLRLKLQYFGHLMQRTDSLVKTLMLGKIEGGRRRGWQRMRWLDGITDSMDKSVSKLWDGDGQGSLVCCSPWACKEQDTTEWLNNNNFILYFHVKCTVHSFLVYS